MATALRIDQSDLGTIQSLKANIELRASLSVAQGSNSNWVETPIQAPPANSNYEQPIILNTTKDIFQSILGTIQSSNTKIHKGSNGIGKFVKEILHEIKELSGHDHPKGKLAEILKRDIQEKMEDLKSNEDHEKKKTEDDHDHSEANATLS